MSKIPLRELGINVLPVIGVNDLLGEKLLKMAFQRIGYFKARLQFQMKNDCIILKYGTQELLRLKITGNSKSGYFLDTE